ncbi:MAG TPA: hypothetical protein VGQ85_00130 [Candidatus Limnocylindrales bacterium]|nr:hypothetical protein [Candidatus Limnocylindrales bacterium]
MRIGISRLLAIAALLAAVSMVAAPAIAAASDSNLTTLTATCDNGQTITFSFALNNGQGAFPRDLHVIEGTSTFTIHEFVLTRLSDGAVFTFGNTSGVDRNHTLVSCSRTGQNFAFTWIGFFTPVG